jgi:hypothetical protein
MDIEDGRLVFFTQPQSRKARNLDRDARIAICRSRTEHEPGRPLPRA